MIPRVHLNGCLVVLSSIFSLELCVRKINKTIQWPNLKNLSGGLNLSRGLNMVVSS